MDDAQRKGIGRLLLQQLLQIAQALGLPHLHGDMLAENQGMRRLAEALQLPYSSTIEAGEMHIIVRVPNVPPSRTAAAFL
jgi:L-amino acid N-acyltransferase YncA